MGLRPAGTRFTILTPCWSALVRNTRRVERITDNSGAMTANPNNFLYFFPCKRI